MTTATEYSNLLPHIEQGIRIPKVIYQTCKEKSSLHPSIQENIAYLQEINPHWEHRLYDDRDIEAFIRHEYGEKIYHYYSKISSDYGAAKADLFRYLIIYKHGGVYLDIKSSVSMPLDEILRENDQYLLSFWANKPGERHAGGGLHKELLKVLPRGEFQQFYICSVAGHPFLRAVLESVFRNIDNYNIFRVGVGFMGVFRTTGPIAYSLAIARYLHSHPQTPYRLIDHSEQNSGIVYSIFEHLGTDAHKRFTGSNYNKHVQPIIANTPHWKWVLYDTYRSSWFRLHKLTKRIGIHQWLKKHLGGKFTAP